MTKLRDTSFLSIGCFVGSLLILTSCNQNHIGSTDLPDTLPRTIDFNYHVKPILSDRCFICHGPDKNARKADLRLDIEEGAKHQKLKNGGYAIVPGNLKKSKAFQRLISTDSEQQMPPAESNLSLSEYEIAIIARWIKQGAIYKPHWAFLSPEKKEPPRVESDWVMNEIDHFILKKIQENNLNPSESANKETLIRRLSFDLTGLPPTLSEIDAFLIDDSPEAYEKVVDRLLASPYYGERMALDWLDIARYADSHGYQDDGFRNTWPWRDWVIQTFNKNLPFDQFVTWQLAGDLLPNPSREQLLATCFNRNHPQTQEGGVVDEEYRVEYVADRTNTFGKAFLGLTMECARCHDHKYDPIAQKEYYGLFAFFNNNNDSGVVPYNGEASPTIILTSPEVEAQLEALKKQMIPLEKEIVSEKYLTDFEEWLQKAQQQPAQSTKQRVGPLANFSFEKESDIDANRIYLDNPPAPKRKGKSDKTIYAYYNEAKKQLDATNWGHVDERPKLEPGKFGQAIRFVGDGGIRFNRDLDFDRNQPFSVSIWIKSLKAGEAGPIFNNTNGDFEGYRGWLCKLNEDGTLSFQLNHVWPDNCIDLQTLEPIVVGQWIHLAMVYDGSSKADGLQIYIDGQKPKLKLLKDNLNKSLLHGVKGTNWSNLPFMLGIELRQSIENMVMDELKVYNRQLSVLEIQELYSGAPIVDNFLQNFDNQKDVDQKGALLNFYLFNRFNPDYNKNLDELTTLRKKENLLLTDQPEVMIMQERSEVRPTFILDRGAYDAPIKEVFPTTPINIFGYREELANNRLGLAQWLLDPENPLTARVAVNRYWAMFFGEGLVATQEDFGNQGHLPIHPELLDWMAIYFMESGWDIKAMLKKIVMSATYRQQSKPSELAKEIDPDNSYFSHFPAHRLSAEMIRDQALAASGLLVRKIGGPSVYPYQPGGLWEALATRNETKYVQQHGDSLYRRSMYTVWKRSSPPPSMLNFDAPDRYFCVVRRQKTTTPLQSLVLMNDPQYVEAARILGERMLREGGDMPASQINFAFRILLTRKPTLKEATLLTQLYEEELKDFTRNPERVKQWLSSGEYPVDKSLNQIELATCSTVASTIMNFDEFSIKR